MKSGRQNEAAQNRHTGGSSRKVPYTRFLWDVFVCSLGAYGGPEAHMGVFLDQMVVRRKYPDEGELVELTALRSILPGPTSTQTIVSIGYKTGGPLLAFLTMAVWALPAVLAMTALSFLYQFLEAFRISTGVLRFIGPAAAGFIIAAAFRIGRNVVVDRATALLAVLGFSAAWFVRGPWVFPAVLAAGGTSMLISDGNRACGAGRRSLLPGGTWSYSLPLRRVPQSSRKGRGFSFSNCSRISAGTAISCSAGDR